MATGPALGANFDGVNFTGGVPLRTYFGSGAIGCSVQGMLSGADVVDDNAVSGLPTNQVRCVGSGVDYPYVLDRFQVRNGVSGATPGISTQAESQYFLDVQEEQVRFYGPNNYVRLNSGIMELAANLHLRAQCGDTSNVVISTRGKSSAPSSDTDGTVVGSQA